MALADIPPVGQSRRLDSWKEIAEYLRRDARTAMRWESQGLPLHRLAGGKGRSVFAFTHEIDAWMAGRGPEPAVEAPPAVSPRKSTGMFVTAVAGGLIAIVGVVVALSSRVTRALIPTTLTVTATAAQVSVADGVGPPRVVHRFGAGAVLVERRDSRLEDLDADGSPDVLAAVANYDTPAGPASGPGEFLDLSLEGELRWRFSFDDAPVFSGSKVAGPWSISDWQTEPYAGPKRVAITAHDSTWWASVVTVLDAKGHRQGTFVNPGWLESVMWRSPDQLAVGGYSNDREGGVLALLDVAKLDGRAPGVIKPAYVCTTCSSDAPMFYAVFPRSELNQVTASRFNRARVSAVGDHLIVTTTEIPRQFTDANAFYEFDSHMKFVRARYSDSYWDMHAQEERAGRLTHTREDCPYREGPPAIDVWDNTRGWIKTFPSGGRQ